MKGAKFLAILASAGLMLAAGCTAVPISNIVDTPVVTNKQNPSLEDISRAIVRAGAALGWQMKEVRPGQIVGTLMLRGHTAVVEVAYNTKAYSIVYKDSQNLDYNPATNTIHRNYNGWVQNLDRDIRAQLTAVGA